MREVITDRPDLYSHYEYVGKLHGADYYKTENGHWRIVTGRGCGVATPDLFDASDLTKQRDFKPYKPDK